MKRDPLSKVRKRCSTLNGAAALQVSVLRKSRKKPFAPGETVNVYDLEGSRMPRFVGTATILAVHDLHHSLYVVRFRNEGLTRVAVVTRSLQGNPNEVLADLWAHWAWHISSTLFGVPMPTPASQSELTTNKASARRATD